jgi:purine catabolism regulator
MTDNKCNVIASNPFGLKGGNLLDYLLPGGIWRSDIHSPGLAMNNIQLRGSLRTVREKWVEQNEFGFDIAIHLIQVEQTLDGYLLVLKHGEAITPIEDYALHVGITVIALERMRAMRVQETERRLQSDFLDDLLNWSIKSPEIIKKQAVALGLNLEDKRGVMVIDVDMQIITTQEQTRNTHVEQLQEGIYRQVESIVAQRSKCNIVMSRGGRILVFLGSQTDQIPSTSTKEQAIALGEHIIQETQPHLGNHFSTFSQAETSSSGSHTLSQTPNLITLSIGISNADYNYASLHQAHADALQALEIGRRLLGPGHVMHIDDTHVYSILDFVSCRKEVRQMVVNVLGPIKAYDALNNTDLLKSLEIIFLSGSSGSEAAKKLYIHRNTLAYRQARIRKLLKFDPFSGQGRIRMEMALMLNKLIEASPD